MVAAGFLGLRSTRFVERDIPIASRYESLDIRIGFAVPHVMDLRSKSSEAAPASGAH